MSGIHRQRHRQGIGRLFSSQQNLQLLRRKPLETIYPDTGSLNECVPGKFLRQQRHRVIGIAKMTVQKIQIVFI